MLLELSSQGRETGTLVIDATHLKANRLGLKKEGAGG